MVYNLAMYLLLVNYTLCSADIRLVCEGVLMSMADIIPDVSLTVPGHKPISYSLFAYLWSLVKHFKVLCTSECSEIRKH